MLPELPNLLKYKNINVINRYTVDFPHNQMRGEEALAELMKFFWLSLKHELDKSAYPEDEELHFICGIHTEMKEIDDMWHTFLLFTRDYADFCNSYLGKFFHHLPTADAERLPSAKFETDFTRFLSYVFDHLGEETVLKWFGPLIQIYSPRLAAGTVVMGDCQGGAYPP